MLYVFVQLTMHMMGVFSFYSFGGRRVVLIKAYGWMNECMGARPGIFCLSLIHSAIEIQNRIFSLLTFACPVLVLVCVCLCLDFSHSLST